jgi:hypothetical protein
MDSRFLHAVTACVVFVSIAAVYGALSGMAVELGRVGWWSACGIAAYIALSFAFGFDPYRSSRRESSPLRYYFDRWELRLGQATLSLLGCAVVMAKLFDETHFVLAVVSSTLAAWTYFAWRLCAGGYDETRPEAVS